jgi:hypothetical protein
MTTGHNSISTRKTSLRAAGPCAPFNLLEDFLDTINSVMFLIPICFLIVLALLHPVELTIRVAVLQMLCKEEVHVKA